MPKISITEKDLSWYYRQRDNSAMTIYCPGTATFGPTDPTLVTSVTEFNQIFRGETGAERDHSYQVAASYLESGFSVLYHRFLNPDASKAGFGKVVVTFTNPTGQEISFSITDERGTAYSYTVPGNSTEEFSIPLTENMTYQNVHDGLAEWIKEDVSSPHAGLVTELVAGSEEGDYLVINSKYEGTAGNRISVRFKGIAGTSKRYMFVYIDDTLVENMIMDFADYTSEYYYLDNKSEYVDIIIYGDFDLGWIYDNSIINLSGGKDFSSATGAYDEIVSVIENEIDGGTFLKDLLDPYNYEFDIITCNGYYDFAEEVPDDSSTFLISKIDEALVGLAKSKGNAIYLVDGDKDWDAETFFTYCSAFNTSYAAAFGPWCRAVLVSVGRVYTLPGSYAFLVTWGNSIAQGNPWWYAPAGVTRASASCVKNTLYRVGSAILDSWQSEDDINFAGYRVNPIMNLKQYGYVINGNSTLIHEDYSRASSLLQQLSIRVLINMIKNQAFDISLSLQYDQMTSDLFIQYKALLGTYLDQLKYNGALYDYQIVADTANVYTSLNTKTIPVTIKISPIPALENLDITIEISKSGVTFSDGTEE